MIRPTPESRVLAGKYRLVERIAQGGMGAVWRAEHVQLHMPVAVKLMSPKMLGSGAFRVRFEREALAVAQLRSRYVVTVHDYGFDGDEPFLVMELLEGEDLAARLRRDRRLSPEAAAIVVGQVARALERAHSAGLVHRDLKPANVFLAHVDDEEVVKVLDFGIAKSVGEEGPEQVTGDDEVLGTPHFMSPEQIRKVGALDPRADLWALSVIAYRMLTGALPFNGETRGDIVVRVCSEPHAPPSARDPSFGPAVDRFFERALAKAPQDRFESARALAAALDQALGTGGAAQGSWQRASVIDLTPVLSPPGTLPPGTFPPGTFPPGTLPPGSLPPAWSPPAAEPPVLAREMPDTTLSLQPTDVLPPRAADRPRRRVIAASVAIAAVSAAIAVPVGLGLLGGGDPVPDVAASGASPSARSIAMEPIPTATATAQVPAIEPAGAPSAEASAPEPTASAQASVSAAPAAPPKPPPIKRRKVQIGL